MNVTQISSWSQFLHEIIKFDQWAFRGQPFANMPLYSSLARRLRQLNEPQDGWALREQRTIRVFKRKAHVHIHDPSALENTFRCMAIMQHHGAATRLLDFTKSPFVAAFFALESATGDAVVYALNTPALWRRNPLFDPSLTRAAINPRSEENLEKYFLSNEFPVIWFGEPNEMDHRLIAQSGLFVVPGQIHLPIDKLLDQYATDDEPLLVQLILSKQMRREAMRELYRMNVTHASLRPDLDGLASSMNQELEIVWQPLLPDSQ
ncbi:FRG domain-containing protein [Orrella daihaiensis]|uniref:FRG domain-containing protein n=1 Tax=Orrella daihaiensis TaxID=2782176 RepID=A0ABY4AIM4_9BURK|nr:FRG domain-containing protein [Orrella daihaiensis]UOD50146.1 FRG domain-containing protein [Orrella daihaiensis]